MSFYTILLIAGALGTDAFSLAVGMGLSSASKQELYLFPPIVAIFHIITPLVGLGLGSILGKVAGQLATYIGGAVLIFIGFHMINEARTKAPSSSFALPAGIGNNSRVLTGVGGLVVAAGSVSLDALTAGFSLGTMQANLALTVTTLGVVAGLMTGAGLFLGRKAGAWLGEKAQLAGGLVLIAIGITMFL